MTQEQDPLSQTVKFSDYQEVKESAITILNLENMKTGVSSKSKLKVSPESYGSK